MKALRQQQILDLLRRGVASSQQELVDQLAARGTVATQTTVSRDLVELGAVKVEGRYRLPRVSSREEPLLRFLEIDMVGEHLAVVRTAPGQASMIALAIDQKGFEEIVGTVAGDDTIFVAVKGRAEQHRAVQKIMNLFHQDTD